MYVYILLLILGDIFQSRFYYYYYYLRLPRVSVGWCFRLESEEHQVSSSPKDSSLYAGRFNNARMWMVSTHPLISKSFSLRTILLVTVLSAPIPIGINVILMLDSFSVFCQGEGYYLSFRIPSFVRRVKFKIPAQFSDDHLPQQLVSVSNMLRANLLYLLIIW